MIATWEAVCCHMIDVPARDGQLADLSVSATKETCHRVSGEGGGLGGQEVQEKEKEEEECRHQGAHAGHPLTGSSRHYLWNETDKSAQGGWLEKIVPLYSFKSLGDESQ